MTQIDTPSGDSDAIAQLSAGRLTHLQRLEAEAIHIMREAVSESDHPAMLYSVGKDSSVMLHLARKAFYPSPPPFPLVHVDTTWKFREMYRVPGQRHRGALWAWRCESSPTEPRGCIKRRHQPVRSRGRRCTPT